MNAYNDEINILFTRLGRSNKDLFWHLFELTTVCWTRTLLEPSRPATRTSEDEVNQLEEFTRVHSAKLPWLAQLTYAEKSTMLRLCVLLCRLDDHAHLRRLLADFDNNYVQPEQAAPVVLRASISSALVNPFESRQKRQQQPEEQQQQQQDLPTVSPPAPLMSTEPREASEAAMVPQSSTVTSSSSAAATTTTTTNKRRIESDEDDDDDDFVSTAHVKRSRKVPKKALPPSALGGDKRANNLLVLPEPPLVTEFIRVNSAKAASHKKPTTTATSNGAAKELPTTRIDMRVDPNAAVECSCDEHTSENLAAHRLHVTTEHHGQYCAHDCAFWTLLPSSLQAHRHQMHHESSNIAACPLTCTEIYGDPKNKGKYPHLRRTFSKMESYHLHMEKTHKWSSERALAESNRQRGMTEAQWLEFITLGTPLPPPPPPPSQLLMLLSSNVMTTTTTTTI